MIRLDYSSMDPATIGKKLKQMYPQYQSVDDATLGSKYILKHGDKGLQALGMSTTDSSKDAANLRKEFTAQSKELGYRDLQNAWNKVQSAEKTGAGDLTILYSYIKALDPTSVVREGEINLTKAAESIPSNIIRAYQQAKQGKIMSDKLRSEMTREVGLMYNERAKQQQELNAYYSGLATDMQIDPQKVVGGVGKVDLAKIPQAMPQEQQQGLQGPLAGILGLAQGATDFLIPETKKLPGKVGGIIERQRQREAAQPNTKGDLGASLKRALNLTAGFAPDVISSVAPAAGEMALLASGKEIGKKVGGITSKILPKKGATGALAEKAGTLKTQKLFEAGEEYVKHNPLAKELWETIKPSIQSETQAKDVMAKMFDVWKGAYSKTGDVRSTAEAQLYNKLYGAGRKVIEEQAPELSSQISKLRFLHQLPKQAQKTSWFALKAAGLGKLLGL